MSAAGAELRGLLVLVSQRELDVKSGEQSKDVRLEASNEQLEEREREAEGEGSNTQQREKTASIQDEEVGSCEEQNQDHVADEHVHEESQCKGDRTHDERRQELNRGDKDVHHLGHACGEEGVLEELTRVLLQTRVNEGNVRDECHEDRVTNNRRCGDVEARDNARDVERERQEEDRHQQGRETATLLDTKLLFNDVLANEVESELEYALAAARDDSKVTGAQPEKDQQYYNHDHSNDHDAVHFEGSAFEENRCGEEVIQGWSVEATLCETERTGGNEVHSLSEQRHSPDSVRLDRTARTMIVPRPAARALQRQSPAGNEHILAIFRPG